jgi:hypothetical protein
MFTPSLLFVADSESVLGNSADVVKIAEWIPKPVWAVDVTFRLLHETVKVTRMPAGGRQLRGTVVLRRSMTS